MVCKVNTLKGQKGFSLTELLVAMAILTIILGIGALSYRETMRGYRAKKAVKDMASAFQDARAIAAKEGFNTIIAYDAAAKSFNIYLDRNGNLSQDPGEELYYVITFGDDHIDPGKPENVLRGYFFEPYTILQPQTREGLTSVTYTGGLGTEVVDEALTDITQIDFANPEGNFGVIVYNNGFMDLVVGGTLQNYAAFLVMNKNDLDESIPDERQYAVTMLKTGVINSYRYVPDPGAGETNWELF